jgi:hypothetical protein
MLNIKRISGYELKSDDTNTNIDVKFLKSDDTTTNY